MTDPRSAMLERIRAANEGPTSINAAQTEWGKLPREYAVRSRHSRKEILEIFRHRLLDYDATVKQASPSDLSVVLASTFKDAGVRRIGIAYGMDQAVLPRGVEYVVDLNLTPHELDGMDAVLSRCTVAIAETGTLVLQGDSMQGRRALTLIPDTHICLVAMSQVVATVPECFARLEATATLPTTFVSGPSATADIEMTRIKGVHGPRFLHVILLEDEAVTHELFDNPDEVRQ